jgi:hypothetical protein
VGGVALGVEMRGVVLGVEHGQEGEATRPRNIPNPTTLLAF